MDPNQRMLPPSTSAVTIEVSLNKRRKDLPADSISAIQVKHDASVSMRLPLFSPTRYRSEAFLVLSSASPSARETKFVNHLEHIPNAYAVASRGSKFTRGALRSNGEECSECVSDHSKELNGGVDCKSHETEEAQGRRVKFNLDSRGSEEKVRKKQNALDRDTKRHCSPLRRQNRVHFDNENIPANDTPTSEARAESMASSSRQGDKETQDRREDGTHQVNWSPINELQQIIEEEKEQQSLPNDATSTEPCEQLETSTDSVESGSEVNPLWVLDSITASVEKCSSPAYDTILEEEVENDIVLDCHADGITQGACSSTFGGTEIEGTACQNQEEEGKDKRLSQGSDGSFGFEPHYEEDFSGYVEGKEYFKNLPTFHRLLTSAEKEELDDEQRQKNELAALRLEDQIPGLHEQSDYAQDMMDTHAMRSEYWDYPYPSRSDAFDTAMRSEDKNELLENMRMKIRGRLRQPGNSSSDSGCQDTDANQSSLDESEAANRLHSPKGRHHEAIAEDKTKKHAETDDLSGDLSDEREKDKLKTRQEKEASSPEHPSSKRRQILEGLSRLIASSEETGLPLPEDSTLESGTEGRRNCIESGSVNEAPTIPVRPMIHGHLQFVHYENITIVKKRTDQERSPHESNNKSDETHVNTRRNTQSPEIMREDESSKSGKADSRVAHSRNMESIAEPIDIDLSDPEVLEATKRMQLAFRKRRGPHGSRKFRSLHRMRAESDSVSDRILGIDSSTSFDKPTPFPVEVSLESRTVQISRHHSLPTNLTHPSAEYSLNGDHSLSTKPKNTNTTNERLCKKLSRQKSVSLYPSSPSSLIEKPKKELTESEVVNQPVHQIDQRMEKCETSNQSVVLSEKEGVKKMSQNQCTSNGFTSSTTVTEMVKSNNALDETAESEDVDVKFKCISSSGETLTNNSETAPIEPVSNSEQEPVIDLKDPKVQDASKMIQQAFRRKKLLSKRSRGSVEEKANKKVQANKVSSGNAASSPNTSSLEETLNTSHFERSASPSILYADTTVNVVIAEVDHDNHTVSNEHHPVDEIQNKSTETRTMANEPPPVITSASVNCQIYKGVMIVDDQLSNPLDRHSKPPLSDKENIVQVDTNATFHSSFEKNKVVKRASSISEASLGDEIDIDLLDAEVKAVTEKLRSVSLVEKPPNGVKIQDHAATNETVQELNNGDSENQISPNSDPQSLNALAKEPPVSEKVREKPKTNGDIDIDLSDPDVQKTAFKLQSAFWKKRTSSKIKSPKGAMSENSNKTNKSTGKSMSTGATTKNKNESVIESKDGKGKSDEDQSNRNELSINSKDTGESQNETSKTNQRLTSSLTCKEHKKTRQSATNNDSMGARPQSPNTNTVSLALKSSKQTEKIDIDLNDSKVKEATKKIQKIFKRKRTPTKTGETSSKGEPKKPVVRLKSNAVVSLGSKHQTKPMISTSFLDRSENGRKEAKAAMVSPDCHGNTDDDEGTKWSSNKGAVEELQKPNDGLADDNKMTHPKGELGDQTELVSTTKESLLPSIDEYVSSKTDSTSEHTTPSTQLDDEHKDGSFVTNDVIHSVPSSTDQSSADKGPKGEKFSHDYNGSRPVSSVYADVDPSPMLPASSTSSLLRMQDEVDIEHLITTSMTTREANGVIRNVSPATCFPTSLTTAPLSRRNRDRDDDADSLRLKSSTAVTHAKSVHGYLEQASDDTEYETAYSDFSDRVDDELERTLVKDDVISTELIQMETTIHHHSPRFLIRPKNASCCHGDRARFVCCITGTPRPDISWFASGKVIRPDRDNRLQITDYSEDNDGNSNACALVSILDIVEVKFLDNGEYACVAINSQGQAFSSAHLTVAEPDPGPVEESAEDENDRLSSQNNNGASAKVDMESSLQDLVHVSSASLPRQKVQALVGSKASFFCPVESDPPLDVKWFKDDVPITSNHGDDRIAVRVEGCVHCLHIRDISVSDQGTYVCSAANDRGSVLCVSLLEVQESSKLDGNQQVKQHTPMLVITEPEKFRQSLENNVIVPLQTKTEETVVPFDSSNTPNTNESNHHGRTNSDEFEVKVVGDAETEDINNVPQTNSGAENNGNSDEILSSVLSTYGPRDLPESNSDDRLSALSNEGVTFKESNGSENYASAEGPPSDENQQTKNKIANGTIPYEGDSLLEAKHHRSSKRRSSRRNHVKSPTKNNHCTSPGDKDVIEDIGLDDANGLIRSKSSRKKRSSSRRKKSPIHSKNVERVRLDLEKAEELTEKVDSCLDIIDDLLTLTSYDENENETEEKLRQKLDTLVHKFADSESDAASLSSRRSTPSHRRKEKLRKVDLLQLSDSNGECLDASDVNLNVSRIQSDGNIWGPCSLEDSLKVMSDLVGNISVTVRDQEQTADYTANANSTETFTNDQEENLNNNNNIHRKGIPNTGLHSGQNVKRTPLRELLKHSLFSQELMTTRIRRRPLPVTRSLDSVDDYTNIPRTSDRRRRHSFGSLYAPRTSRPARHPLLRTLSMRRRNRTHSVESSSSDDDSPDRFRGVNIVRCPRPLETGRTSDDCPSHAESTDSLLVELEDKFQQFPDGDRLSSPIGFEDSDCSLEDHNLPDRIITTRFVNNGNFIPGRERLPEYEAVETEPELSKDSVGEDSLSISQHKIGGVGLSANDISKRCTDNDQEYVSKHDSNAKNSSKTDGITSDNVSRNGTHSDRIPQENGSYNQDKDVDEDDDDHADNLLNVSRNDSGFSSGPLATDRLDNFF